MAELKGSQCVVSAADYAQHWEGKEAPEYPTRSTRYDGPDRRANTDERRFYAGQGGRRILDRKS